MENNITTKRVQNEDNGRFESKFDIKVGERVIELSQMGFSLEAIAGELGVTRKTIYNWREKYPEFAHLCEIAQGKRLFAWEKKIIDAESGPAVQAASLALRATGLKEWNDKRQVDINVDVTNKLDLNKMSPADIKSLMNIVQQQQIASSAEDAEYEEMDEN